MSILKCGAVRYMCGIKPTPHKHESTDIQRDTVYAVRCAVKNAITFYPESLLDITKSIYLTLGDCLPMKTSLSA